MISSVISTIVRAARPLLLRLLVVLAALGASLPSRAEPPVLTVADPQTYLADISKLCRTDWPKNRTVNIVCHGHSVPAGYFKTPEVRSLEAYPHLLRMALSEKYPHAVINIIVTAIGGENSESGAARFDGEVMRLKPDLVLIDYALNDRRIGLEHARVAWTSMIKAALAAGVKVLLLTPTPDTAAALGNADDPLNQHAAQVRSLAAEYRVGLVDSLSAFEQAMNAGQPLNDLMSQGNHPNGKGHQLVAKALSAWFP